MKLKRLSQMLATSYSFALLLALFMPRKYPENSVTPTNLIARCLHEILYYSGTLEPLANFLLLVPVFLLVASAVSSNKLMIALIVCCLISILAEFGQSFIPGRVSSSQDLLLNIGGALMTMFILFLSGRFKSSPKI